MSFCQTTEYFMPRFFCVEVQPGMFRWHVTHLLGEGQHI